MVYLYESTGVNLHNPSENDAVMVEQAKKEALSIASDAKTRAVNAAQFYPKMSMYYITCECINI